MSGQTVAASFQTPTLFLIAKDLTQMQVDTNVSESDIGNVRDGQAGDFSVDAFPGRMFEGSVGQVRQAPITVQNVVTYDVVVTVENPELMLKPGMTANVTIITARRDNVLRVPIAGAALSRPKSTRVRCALPAERPPSARQVAAQEARVGRRRRGAQAGLDCHRAGRRQQRRSAERRPQAGGPGGHRRGSSEQLGAALAVAARGHFTHALA